MAIKNVSISNVVAVQNACYVMGVEEVWCQIKFTDCVNFCEYIADPNSGEALSRELYTRLQDGDYGELNHGTGDHYTLKPKTQTELEAAVKATRTQRLLESDWTGLPDMSATMTSVQRSAWSTYRQALRDVPAQTRFPWDPDWPTSP
jgi:hypothetical protein